MKIKDTIPKGPAAELSLDNVLIGIRFRGKLGFKLADYAFAAGNVTVILEFESCGSEKSKNK
jgi:hypothetical protein